MRDILPHITNTQDYLDTLEIEPGIKVLCPNCGHRGCTHHGQYQRKPHRGLIDRHLNPVPVLRYRCLHCARTFSRPPEYLAIHRWYDWNKQAAALLAYLKNPSYRATAKQLGMHRHTIARWVRGFRRQLIQHHADTLRPYFRELVGYARDMRDFWQSWLAKHPLGCAMRFCYLENANYLHHKLW
jgi:transposase-like protein